MDPALPRWLRWGMPSFSDVFFLALLGVLTFTPISTRLLGDAGIGWHIRTGQHVLATHSIPHTDLFSSTMQGKPWFAWEWLYDVVVGKVEQVAGLNGVVLLTTLLIACVFACTFRLVLRRGTSLWIAVVLLLLAASASMIHFLARPHIVSWLFSLLCFWALDASEESARAGTNASRQLWLLPGLMIVWVNMHGGWLVGFVLLGIYWIAAVQMRFSSEDSLRKHLPHAGAGQHLQRLTLVGIACAVATLLNPYGWTLHSHIYGYLSNRFLMDHIEEFRSPNFHGIAEKCFAVLILLVCVACASRPNRLGLSHVLTALFAIYAGLLASRNIPVSSLLLVFVSAPLLAETAAKFALQRSAGSSVRAVLASSVPWKVTPTFSQRMVNLELSLRGHLWVVAAIVLSAWIALHGGRMGSSQLMNAHFDSHRFPVAAVDEVAQSASVEPILAPDYWGGYLIYRLYPKVTVVADDRHDFYGEEFFKSYLRFVHVEDGWADFPARYGVKRMLIPSGSALSNMLLETSGWRAVYRDDVAILFERSSD